MTSVREAPVRTVFDESKTLWHVYVVLEPPGTDPGSASRRRDWLCIASKLDRRFIAPIPPGWASWSDRELLTAIRRATPDLREWKP